MPYFLLLYSVFLKNVFFTFLFRQAHAVVFESLTLARIKFLCHTREEGQYGDFTQDVKLLPLAKPQCNYTDPLKPSHTYGEGHIHKHEFEHTEEMRLHLDPVPVTHQGNVSKQENHFPKSIHLLWLEAGDKEHVPVIKLGDVS